VGGQDKDTIAAHLSHHTTRLATELVIKRYLARRLTVFLTLKSFASHSAETKFDNPTAKVFTFSQAVRDTLARLYRPDEHYRGCGVIATEICPASEREPDLFGNGLGDEGKEKRIATVDVLNKKYGNHTELMSASLAAIKHKNDRGSGCRCMRIIR
jgi:hypothetical protein